MNFPLPMKNWNKATDILKGHRKKEYHITASLRYGRPNGAKFKNSNLITFKDNDYIRIQEMKINQIQRVWKAKWCKIQEAKLSSHSTNFLSRSREISIKLTKIKSRSTDFLSRSRHILIKLNNKN